jgi:hypothetical protein
MNVFKNAHKKGKAKRKFVVELSWLLAKLYGRWHFRGENLNFAVKLGVFNYLWTSAGFIGKYLGMNIGEDISRDELDPMTGICEKSGIELKNRKRSS